MVALKGAEVAVEVVDLAAEGAHLTMASKAEGSRAEETLSVVAVEPREAAEVEDPD